MKATGRIRIVSAASLIFFFSASWLLLFKLSSGLDLNAILASVRERAAFACIYRCLGIAPFLPLLMKSGRLLLLVFLALALLAAVVKTLVRISRTQKYIRAVEKRVAQTTPLFQSQNLVRIFKDQNPLAFTAGFFSPKIYLSTALTEAFDNDELKAVVLHESHHQKKKDPLKSLLLSFLADFLFFVPIAQFFKKSCFLALEVSADSYCAAHNVDPLEIACALLRVQKRPRVNASWFFDQNQERIRALLGQPIRVFPSLNKIIVSLALLVIILFFYFIPIKKGRPSDLLNHEKTCEFRQLDSRDLMSQGRLK
jgi:beta-lactamase regulating signal transducer with metallopeptidase domain